MISGAYFRFYSIHVTPEVHLFELCHVDSKGAFFFGLCRNRNKNNRKNTWLRGLSKCVVYSVYGVIRSYVS